MKLTPLFDRIIVMPVPEGKTTKGGLLIPDVASQTKPFIYADVLCVGPGRVGTDGQIIPMSVKAGDVVMFPRKSGQLVPLSNDDDSEPGIIIRETDIFSIVTDLPRDTGLLGMDGRLLAMRPTSNGLPDSVYKNRTELEIAERAGWDSGHDLTESEPGEVD